MVTAASIGQPDCRQPQVWLLTGHKAGDNNQVLALGDALGWPYRRISLVYRPWELLSNRLLGVTLSGIDRQKSTQLHPPWPDIVITAGRRNEPVARWIQRQSGKKVRLVHIGRPWASLDCFDLIVTTPQYFLPQRENILHNRLPLHRVDEAVLQQAASEWSAKLADLPRPWLAVLLGGDSGPFVFTPEKARRLAEQVNNRVQHSGGSLLVSTSARTPADAWEAFRHCIRVPHYYFEWHKNTGNPYFAYLALADEFVVSGESMSMLTEVCATGKPLFIFDPGDDAGPHKARPWWRIAHNFRYKPLTHRLAMQFGPKRMRRDISRIQRELVASGQAVWLGDDWPADGSGTPPADLERAVQRIRSWFC